GRVRDLSAVIGDIDARTLSPNALTELAALDPTALPLAEAQRFGMPWTGIGKIVAIGLNYADHAAEANMPIPSEPIVF
ncbi:ureidoglycolate lyase, partial [Acinetobacter baumannii]